MSVYIILLLITLISSLLYAFYFGTPHQTQNQIKPYEGFSRKFFRQITPTYFFGLNRIELGGNTYKVIKLLSEMIPYNLNQVLLEKNIDSFRLLNDNKIQFILAQTHVLHNIMYKTMPELADIKINNVRFVATLFRMPINILTCSLEMNEFADLKDSGLSINVGQKYSGEYFVALDLLLGYGLVVGRDIYLKYYEGDDIISHYGKDVDVVILIATHPDLTVLNLVNKKLTRFIQIKKYNNGDIFNITLDEKPFYKENYYYHKTILEKSFLRQYYTNLVLDAKEFNPHIEKPLVTNNLSNFLDTIGVQYYLLSNQQTLAPVVAQLLYNMKINIDQFNKLEFIDQKITSATLGDFSLKLDTHKGAREFYFKSGIYTYINNPACPLIDGKCTEAELYKHKLINQFGRTFNEIYNQNNSQDYLYKGTPQ